MKKFTLASIAMATMLGASMISTASFANNGIIIGEKGGSSAGFIHDILIITGLEPDKTLSVNLKAAY